VIEIYTDGSCYNGRRVGVWAAILFIAGEKIVLSDLETGATNHRMELAAVIKAIEYVRDKHPSAKAVRIVSDSQYVIGLARRKTKFLLTDFKTKKGNDIRNVDLMKQLLELHEVIDVEYVKIKAHQQPTETANYNIEADMLARKILRDYFKDGNIVWRTKQ
jgi:ribonuclease HI